MEERFTRIAEANKEKYEFKRDVLVGGINPRTGKIMAEKVTRYYEEKQKQKDGLLEKLKLKNRALRSQNNKLLKQLQQREDMGEVLKEIDFAQLKIENKQYSITIDEKNNDLIRLKLTTGNATQVLNALMEKLNQLTSQSEWLKGEIKYREQILERVKEDIEKAITEKRIATTKNDQLKHQHESVKVPEIIDYVQQKTEEYQLKKKVLNWERKVEISLTNAKVYRQKLKQNQIKVTGRLMDSLQVSKNKKVKVKPTMP